MFCPKLGKSTDIKLIDLFELGDGLIWHKIICKIQTTTSLFIKKAHSGFGLS